MLNTMCLLPIFSPLTFSPCQGVQTYHCLSSVLTSSSKGRIFSFARILKRSNLRETNTTERKRQRQKKTVSIPPVTKPSFLEVHTMKLTCQQFVADFPHSGCDRKQLELCLKKVKPKASQSRNYSFQQYHNTLKNCGNRGCREGICTWHRKPSAMKQNSYIFQHFPGMKPL